jgi:hypothetical protein
MSGEDVVDIESPAPAGQYLAHGLPIGSWCWHDQRHPPASTRHHDRLTVLGTVEHGGESPRHFRSRHLLHGIRISDSDHQTLMLCGCLPIGRLSHRSRLSVLSNWMLADRGEEPEGNPRVTGQ